MLNDSGTRSRPMGVYQSIVSIGVDGDKRAHSSGSHGRKSNVYSGLGLNCSKKVKKWKMEKVQ